MLPCLVTTHKANSPHSRRITNKVDRVRSTVNDVDDSLGDSSLGSQLGNDHRCAWVPLRRLQEEGVSSHDSHRDGPKGNHGGEVEGGDGGDYSEGGTTNVGVHTLGDFLVLALECVGDGACGLDYLESTENVAHGVWEGLALLEDDRVGEGGLVLVDQCLQAVFGGGEDIEVGLR